jgi:hypothetical protein
MNNVRREASGLSRTKTKRYLKDKCNEPETDSMNKNNLLRDLYSGMNEFKKGYQPRTNLVKYEKDDLFADTHSILNM